MKHYRAKFAEPYPKALQRMIRQLIFIACLAARLISAASDIDYRPTVNGTIRTKYECSTIDGSGRFQMRNARLSLSGLVMPWLTYKAEADLCDKGRMRMLDAYARITPANAGASLTIGQMRVPFSIDAHRSPHRQYFVNRSFIAKQAGNVRDIGLAAKYALPVAVPVTIEAGVFNGSGLAPHADYWTKRYNFSAKATATLWDRLTLQASAQSARPDSIGIMMWDAGASFHTRLWHIEAEYLRKTYARSAFPTATSVDAFVCRTFPMTGDYLHGISALGRYDYLSDHSDGIRDENGMLEANDPERHRMTLGLTLHFGGGRLRADLRVNYEKYFYPGGIRVPVSEGDKVSVELVCRF